jgi:hypothetical protein
MGKGDLCGVPLCMTVCTLLPHRPLVLWLLLAPMLRKYLPKPPVAGASKGTLWLLTLC